jgi:hypothetical protein
MLGFCRYNDVLPENGYCKSLQILQKGEVLEVSHDVVVNALYYNKIR